MANSEKKKKCVKCGAVKPLEMFGTIGGGSERQSYCKACKNALGRRRREKNVTARLRHHISTRAADQLGAACPSDITRNLDSYLGYRVTSLVKALRDDLHNRGEGSLRRALNEGMHVDHIRPLSSFRVVREDGSIDWNEFQACWAISNLKVISAEENLRKGARHPDEIEDR